MTKDFKLPLVGLGTCYYEFSAFPVYERLVCGLSCHELGQCLVISAW